MFFSQGKGQKAASSSRYIPYSNSSRLGMWIWAQDIKTQINCDSMINFSKNRLTDLFVFAIDDSITPRTWLGSGTKGVSNNTSILGRTPLGYVIHKARQNGIRVHAWMWLSTFVYWGGTTGLLTPQCPNNSTYNDSGVWNFHNAAARTLMIDAIVDFVNQNPGLTGINFNHEATTANITFQDMTDFFTELRSRIPDLEFSLCTGTSIVHDDNLKFSMGEWLSNGLIDTVVTMGYYDDWQSKKNYLNSLPVLESRNLIIGLGAETNSVGASDFRYNWNQAIEEEKYTNFCIFCWGSNLKNNANLRSAVDQYLGSGLTLQQNPITRITVVPGTSFTITVNGVDQSTLYSNVTDHTYSGPLKSHVESTFGSENPALMYYRNDSAFTNILLGGYEP